MTMLHVLQHALGLDQHGRGQAYRTHFVTGDGSVDWPHCNEAVDRGLMVRRESQLCGGDSCFIVTDAGKRYVAAESPPPPAPTKKSVGQDRYDRWLRADWFADTFGEWLKSPYAAADRQAARSDAPVKADPEEIPF